MRVHRSAGRSLLAYLFSFLSHTNVSSIKHRVFANLVITPRQQSRCHHLHLLEEQAVNLRHNPQAAMEVNITVKLVLDFNLLFTLLDDASFVTAGEMADLFLLRKSNSTLIGHLSQQKKRLTACTSRCILW